MSIDNQQDKNKSNKKENKKVKKKELNKNFPLIRDIDHNEGNNRGQR